MSEEVETTNSAERLLVVLKQVAPTNPQTYGAVWKAVFRPTTDTLEIFQCLSSLNELINQVESEILSMPNIRHTIFLQPLPILRRHIQIDNLSISSQELLRDIPSIVNTLEFCSDALSRTFPEPKLSRTDLDPLLATIDEALKMLPTNGPLDKKLRDVIFALLTAARTSILSYQVKGAKGMRKDLFAIFAIVQIHMSDFQTAKETPAIKGFDAIMRKFDEMTARALHVKEVFTSAAPLFTAIATTAHQLL